MLSGVLDGKLGNLADIHSRAVCISCIYSWGTLGGADRDDALDVVGRISDLGADDPDGNLRVLPRRLERTCRSRESGEGAGNRQVTGLIKVSDTTDIGRETEGCVDGREDDTETPENIDSRSVETRFRFEG